MVFIVGFCHPSPQGAGATSEPLGVDTYRHAKEGKREPRLRSERALAIPR